MTIDYQNQVWIHVIYLKTNIKILFILITLLHLL